MARDKVGPFRDEAWGNRRDRCVPRVVYPIDWAPVAPNAIKNSCTGMNMFIFVIARNACLEFLGKAWKTFIGPQVV